MSNSPEQIEADIEAPRADLSRDVDALAQTVSPVNVAARQREKVTAVVSGVREKATSAVFGAKDAVTGQAAQAQSSTGEAALRSEPSGTCQGESPAGEVQRHRRRPESQGRGRDDSVLRDGLCPGGGV